MGGPVCPAALAVVRAVGHSDVVANDVGWKRRAKGLILFAH